MLFRYLTILFLLSFLTIIVNVSLQTGLGKMFSQAMGLVPHTDKAVHLIMMALFSFLLNGALNRRQLHMAGRKWLLGSVIVALFMTLEECSQAFIPARNFEMMDLVCNYAGIYVGGVLVVLLLPRHNHKTNVISNERNTAFSIQAIFHKSR